MNAETRKVFIVPFFLDGNIEEIHAFENVERAYQSLADWVDKPRLEAEAMKRWPNEDPSRVRDLLTYQLIDEGKHAGTLVWEVSVE